MKQLHQRISLVGKFGYSHILRGIAEPLVAVQSMDPEVLKNIKRDNIKMSALMDLVKQGHKDGLPMVTDVLFGLPGETLRSHLNTLRQVFAVGFASFNTGPIRLLPGSEMAEDATVEKFELKTKFRFISNYSGIYDGEPVCEYEDAIVETSTMSQEEMFSLRVYPDFPTIFRGFSEFFVGGLDGKGPVEARGKRTAFSKARWARSVRPRPRQLPQGPSVCDKMAPAEGIANWTAGVLGLRSTRE